MLRQVKEIEDLGIVAIDGTIGDVSDLYFDDQAWVVRYIVVNVGAWLARREVLLSPLSAGRADWEASVLPVALTRDQVRNSPDIDTDKPVTRQHETELLGFYNYPYYWGGLGIGMYGGALDTVPPLQTDAEAEEVAKGDRHLRSCRAVRGYRIDAADGEIGQVKDFLVEEESWTIRYLVVGTGSWWLGHDVLLPARWIRGVSWERQTMAVDLARDTLKSAPRYDPSVPLTRELESAVHRHYGRPGYWEPTGS